MSVSPGGIERARVTLKVIPDVSEVYDAVNEAVKYIEGLKPEMKVELDLTGAYAELEKFIRQAESRTIKIDVDLNKLGNISDLYDGERVTVDLDLDDIVDRVREAIEDGAFLAGDAEVRVDMDTSDAMSDMADLSDEWARVTQQIADDYDRALSGMDYMSPDLSRLKDDLKDALDDIRDDIEPIEVPAGIKFDETALRSGLGEMQDALDAAGLSAPVAIEFDDHGGIRRALEQARELHATLTSLNERHVAHIELDYDRDRLEAFMERIGIGSDNVVRIHPELDEAAWRRAIDRMRGSVGDPYVVDIEPHIETGKLKELGNTFERIGKDLATQLYAPFAADEIIDADVIIDEEDIQESWDNIDDRARESARNFRERWTGAGREVVRYMRSTVAPETIRAFEEMDEAATASAERATKKRAKMFRLFYGQTIPSYARAWLTGDREVWRQYLANYRKYVRDTQAESQGLSFEAKKVRSLWESALNPRAGETWRQSIKISLGNARGAFRAAAEGIKADAEKHGRGTGQAFSKAFSKSFTGVKDAWSNLFTQRFWMQAAIVGGVGAGGDLLTVGAGLNDLVGSFAMLPAVVGGAVGAVASFKASMVGMGEAITSNDPEVVAEAMRRLPPEARKFAQAIRDVAPAWEEMRKKVQNTFFEGLASQFRTMSKVILPDLGKGLTAQAKGWNAWAKAAFGAVTQMGKTKVFSTVLTNAGKGMQNSASGINSLLTAFGILAVEGSKFFPQMGRDLSYAARDFKNWIAQAAKSGKIAEWIKAAGQAIRDLGSITKSTVRFFAALTRAAENARKAAGLTGTALTGLARGFENLVKSMEGARFQKAATAYFTGVNAGMKAMGDIAGPALTDALEAIAYALGRIFKAAGPAIGKGLRNFFDMIARLAPHVAKLVEKVAPAVEKLFDVLFEQNPALAGALGEVLGAIGDVLVGVLTIITDFIAAGGAEVVISMVKAFAQFASAIGRILTAVAPLVGPLAILFRLIYDFFIGPLLQNIVGITEGLADFVEGIAKMFVPGQAWEGIKQSLAGLGRILYEGVLFALNFFKLGFLAKILGPLKAVLPMGAQIGLRLAQAFFEAVMRKLPSILTGLTQFGARIASAIGGWIAPAAAAAGRFFVGVGQWFARLPGAIIGHLRAIAAGIATWGRVWVTNGIKFAKEVAAGLQQWFIQARIWVVAQLRALGAEIVRWGAYFVRKATEAAKAVAAGLRQWFIQARIWVVAQLRAIGAEIVRWGAYFVRKATEAARALANAFHYWFGLARAYVSAAMAAAAQAVVSAMQRMASAVGSKVREIVAWFQNLPGRIVNALRGLPGALWGIGANMISGLINGIKAQWDPNFLPNMFRQTIANIKESLGIRSPSTVFADIGGYLVAGFLRGVAAFSRIDLTKPMGAIRDKVLDFWGIHSPSTVMADIAGNVMAGWQVGIDDATPHLITDMKAFITRYKRAVEDQVAKEFRDLARYIGTTFRAAFSGSSEDVMGAVGELSERFGQMSDTIWERTKGQVEAIAERITATTERMVEQQARVKAAQAAAAAAAKKNASRIALEKEQLAIMAARLRIAKQTAAVTARTPAKDNSAATIQRERQAQANLNAQIAKEQREINRLRAIRGKTAAEQVGYNRRIAALQESIADKRRRIAQSDARADAARSKAAQNRAQAEADKARRVASANLSIRQQELAIARQRQRIAELQGKGNNSALVREQKKLADLAKEKARLQAEVKKVAEEGRRKEAAMEWAKAYLDSLGVMAKGISEQRDKIREALEKATADWEDWKNKITSYIEGVQSSVRDAMNITAAFDDAATGKAMGAGFLSSLTDALSGAAAGSGVADMARVFQAKLSNAMAGVGGESVQSVMDAMKAQLDALGPQVGESEARLVDRLRMMVVGAVESTLSPGMAGVIDRARGQLDKVKDFSQTVKRLISLGLNKTSLDQIIQAGPFSEMAGVWKDANAAQVVELNAMMAEMEKYSGIIGTDGAEALFGAGRDAAKALVDGLASQEKALTAQLQRIADTMERIASIAAGVSVPDIVGEINYKNPTATTAASGPGRNPDGSYAPVIATPVIHVQIGNQAIDGYIEAITVDTVTGAVSAAAGRNGI